MNNYNYRNNNSFNNSSNNRYSYDCYYQLSNKPERQKSNAKWWLIGSSIVIGVAIIFFILVGYSVNKMDKQKNRTFMIYMVGSDLESKSKQGTYSISDISGEKIDLDHNNVVLIVGGSTKWHNFVSTDEIGIYELTKDGFKKRESWAVRSMGNEGVLKDFLDYSYENYPARKYDMIFWNHGLGAIGVEQDEVSNDYLSILDLDNAFAGSKFADNRLELTIFYNCLEANLQIAKVMSKYSDYMVASEEILYLSKVLNRLNFLEKVNVNDDAYKVATYFIEQSDNVVNAYNSTHANSIDSTLSIIDLRKIKELDNSVNEFIRTINMKSDYYSISNIRKNLYTYGRTRANDYDTVDLYELVSSLMPLSSDISIAQSTLNLINETVLYNSSLNNHSNGISTYFPYYGNDVAIGIHLSTFKRLLNDSYYSFIYDFYSIRSGFKTAGKVNEKNINILTNDVVSSSNSLSLELTDSEVKKFQYANVYLFEKNGDDYELLLESDGVSLENNKIVFDNNVLLEVNGINISFINGDSKYVYGKLSDEEDSLNTVFNLNFKGNLGEIVGTILDSGIYPLSGLVEYDEYDNISFARLKYKLFDNGNFDMNWLGTEVKDYISVDKNNIELTLKKNDLHEYYALFEMYDVNNEVYYSKLGIIN